MLEDGDPVPLLWTTKPSIPMRLRPLKPHPKLGIRSFQRCRIDPNFCWPSQSRFFLFFVRPRPDDEARGGDLYH